MLALSVPCGLHMPDALALDAGAYPLHRAGFTGRGVVVCLVGGRVLDLPFFRERCYLVSDAAPRPGRRNDRFATVAAAALLSVAPDVIVTQPSGSGEQAPDLVVQVRGVPLPEWEGRVVLAPTIALSQGLPEGPYLIPGLDWVTGGRPVQVGTLAGLAALLISAEHEPERALEIASAAGGLDLARFALDQGAPAAGMDDQRERAALRATLSSHSPSPGSKA